MTSKSLGRQEYFEQAVDRFWSKVDRRASHKCWMWKGTKALPLSNGMQYGSFGFYDGKTINYRVHRFAWMLANGRIPDGKVIMHRCDVPLCVNPRHLRLGTQIENMQDMVDKGRVAKGEAQGFSKLTEKQALFAKRSTVSPNKLGKLWGVHPTCITAIRKGKNWKHLDLVEARQ